MAQNNEVKVDEDGFEQEERSGEDINNPFDPSEIDIVSKYITVDMLKARLSNKELDLTPDFQRQSNLWDAKKKSRLIESVLLRIPLPSFYFSESDDGVYSVVDGLQRLCAIFHFIDVEILNNATRSNLSPLRLVGLQYLKELEGKGFLQLDRKFQRRIVELEVSSNIIRAGTPPSVKFNVFARLNQGGLPLNAQEIRNAIYRGNWRTHISELAESALFIKVTEGKIRKDRQQDLELVLRFIALWQLGGDFKRPLNQTLDEFLNNSVEKILTSWDESKWDDAKDAFFRSLKLVKEIFGQHAFRKSHGNNYRTPINRGLFEVQMIVLSTLDDGLFERLKQKKTEFIEKFVNALNFDTSFSTSLLYATGSADASNTRIKTVKNILDEVLND